MILSTNEKSQLVETSLCEQTLNQLQWRLMNNNNEMMATFTSQHLFDMITIKSKLPMRQSQRKRRRRVPLHLILLMSKLICSRELLCLYDFQWEFSFFLWKNLNLNENYFIYWFFFLRVLFTYLFFLYLINVSVD